MILDLLIIKLTVVLTLGCYFEKVLGFPLSQSNTEGFDVDSDEISRDEQTIVPDKRAALLLDKLLVALQKAVNEDEIGKGGSKSYTPSSTKGFVNLPEPQRIPFSKEKTMDLQRRGQGKGRVYWRCYFNAVTCFRK